MPNDYAKILTNLIVLLLFFFKLNFSAWVIGAAIPFLCQVLIQPITDILSLYKCPDRKACGDNDSEACNRPLVKFSMFFLKMPHSA